MLKTDYQTGKISCGWFFDFLFINCSVDLCTKIKDVQCTILRN